MADLIIERTFTVRNQLEALQFASGSSQHASASILDDQAYDDAMRPTVRQLANGIDTTIAYRTGDNLVATIDAGPSSSVSDFDYTYDANKRKLTEDDDVSAMMAFGQTFSGYDGEDRLTGW